MVTSTTLGFFAAGFLLITFLVTGFFTFGAAFFALGAAFFGTALVLVLGFLAAAVVVFVAGFGTVVDTL